MLTFRTANIYYSLLKKSTRRRCVAGFFAKPTFWKDAIVAIANTTGYAKLILCYMCVDFTSPPYFMGWDSFGGGLGYVWGGFSPPSPGLATSLLMNPVEPPFAVLHNTYRIGSAPIGRHLVGFGSVNCKPVNRNFSEFVYLLTVRIKLEIVPTREITTKIVKTFLFLVGGRGPISWMGLG